MSAAALAPAPVTPDQVRAIHVLKAKAGLSEPDYRAALAGFGATSSKELSRTEAGALIERLKGLSGADAAIRPASATVTGPYAGKLRALWISGFHLGVVRERDDRALIAFIERQTGLAHPRFLTDPASARRAIEALKSWLAREGGVVWPTDARADAIALKEAVVRAQTARLTAANVFVEWPVREHLDDTIARLGAAIRAMPRSDRR